MNQFLKTLVILGFVLIIGGLIILNESLPHHVLKIPDNTLTENFAFLFWYVEPIIGLVLVFVSKKRKMKYFGAFFFILWICAVINYIFT